MDLSANSFKTKAECVLFLKQLGLRPGKVLLVHQGVSSLWPLQDGAITLMESLLEVLGDHGTLCVMNSYLNNQMETMKIEDEPMRLQQLGQSPIKHYRNALQSPLFLALSRKEGRTFSSHPRYNLCCVGKYAKYITHEEQIDFPFGEDSCLQTIFELKADYLIIDQIISECEELKLVLAKIDHAPIRINTSVDFIRQGGEVIQYLEYQEKENQIKRILNQEKLFTYKKMNQNHFYFSNYYRVIQKIVEQC